MRFLPSALLCSLFLASPFALVRAEDTAIASELNGLSPPTGFGGKSFTSFS